MVFLAVPVNDDGDEFTVVGIQDDNATVDNSNFAERFTTRIVDRDHPLVIFDGHLNQKLH